MHVEYWGVGSLAANPLGMTTAEIGAQIVADWLPSMPSAMSAALVGWPPFILEEFEYGQIPNQHPHLTLRAITARSERQWKGMLSWMLGVAGTRQVLQAEAHDTLITLRR